MNVGIGWPAAGAKSAPRVVALPVAEALLGPPGVLFYAATTSAIVVALDANSRGSFLMLLVTALTWLVLAAIWLIRFVGVVWTQRFRLPLRHWGRWLVIPVAMGLIFGLTRTDIPFDARLAASQGAMNQAATEVMAGSSIDRRRIGLYPVQDVEKIPNGMRFVIENGLLGTLGFAYSTAGRPANLDNSPLWCCDTYEPLGGGWWLWVQSWD